MIVENLKFESGNSKLYCYVDDWLERMNDRLNQNPKLFYFSI